MKKTNLIIGSFLLLSICTLFADYSADVQEQAAGPIENVWVHWIRDPGGANELTVDLQTQEDGITNYHAAWQTNPVYTMEVSIDIPAGYDCVTPNEEGSYSNSNTEVTQHTFILSEE